MLTEQNSISPQFHPRYFEFWIWIYCTCFPAPPPQRYHTVRWSQPSCLLASHIQVWWLRHTWGRSTLLCPEWHLHDWCMVSTICLWTSLWLTNCTGMQQVLQFKSQLLINKFMAWGQIGPYSDRFRGDHYWLYILFAVVLINHLHQLSRMQTL